MKRILIPVVLAAVLLTGCGKALEPFHDAGTDGRDRGPAEIIEMPDGFGNAADKCNHGNRVYTLYHNNSKYGAIAVVPHDPTCK